MKDLINDINNDKILQETILLPFDLQPIAQLDNNKVYGSKKLDTKIIDILSKQSTTKDHMGLLSNLINNKKIVICFLSKGIIKFLLWRIFAPVGLKGIQAFYAPSNKKIFVLLSNVAIFIGYASNKFLGSLIIHECMHMVSMERTTKFLDIFLPDLINYYKNYFTDILYLDNVPDTEIEKFVLFLINNLEWGDIKGKTLDDYKKQLMLLKRYTKGDKNTFDKNVNLVVESVFSFLKGYAHKDPYSFVSKYKTVLRPLYKAYRTAFNYRNFNTFCIQELCYPSEVIAIYSESGFIQNKVNSSLKLMN